MERNDLIERVRALLADEAADFEADLVAASETGERIDLDAREIDVPVDWLHRLLATIERLTAEKEEAERDGWMPIETAPKDGSLIDLWARRETTGKFDRYTECQWGRRNFGSEPYGEPVWLGLQDQYSVITPTHWRRPPAPPRDLSQGDQP